MSFEARINKILDDIMQEKKLPEKSIYLFSNTSSKGENKGVEISKSLCISEPEYPSNPNKGQIKNKSYVIMNVQNQTNIELLIRNKQFEEIDVPSNATVKELKSDVVFKHIVFEEGMESLYDYIRSNVIYCVDNYESSCSFGCCSRFEECSDAKRCIHENKLYAKGCSYRRNLDSGKIFYGVNRNID